jgi:acetyl-CoA carboxylase biotin carboxyl carrier protein
MTLDEIKQILDMVREHALAEFELEQDGVKIRIRKDGGVHVVNGAVPAGAAPAVAAPAAVAAATPAPGPQAVDTSADAAANDSSVELAVVKSPIVGTFYRAPDPSAPAFVETGQVVRKGQVLCIIEAMKLMNEIESEYEGEIVKIYVENGQPVQFGERLFAIKAR